MSKAWIKQTVGETEFELLSLQHPEFDARVIEDTSQRVKVYYNHCREVSEVLTDWLGQNRKTMERNGLHNFTLLEGRYETPY